MPRACKAGVKRHADEAVLFATSNRVPPVQVAHIGILANIRHKLFQPFFTNNPTGEGTGTGLLIPYGIITTPDGGTIIVDNEVDAFAEFLVTLPRRMFEDGEGRTWPDNRQCRPGLSRMSGIHPERSYSRRVSASVNVRSGTHSLVGFGPLAGGRFPCLPGNQSLYPHAAPVNRTTAAANRLLRLFAPRYALGGPRGKIAWPGSALQAPASPTNAASFTPWSAAIISAAFSPIMIDGALVLPLITLGMTLASATRRLPTPSTRSRGSTTSPIRHVQVRWYTVNE